MLLDLKIINENDEPPIFNEPDGTVIKARISNYILKLSIMTILYGSKLHDRRV